MTNQNRVPKWASGMTFILIIAALVYFFTSWREKKQEAKYDYIERQYQEKKRIVDSIAEARSKESDSLNLIIANLQKQNEEMKESRNKKVEEIEEIKKEEIPEFDKTEDILKFFSEEYENSIIQANNRSVEFRTPSVREMAKDLTLLGQYERQIPKYEEIISSSDLQIDQLERITGIQSTVITSCNNEVKERKYLQELSDESIKELKGTVKREKRKNFILKIVVPISVALSSLATYKIVTKE